MAQFEICVYRDMQIQHLLDNLYNIDACYNHFESNRIIVDFSSCGYISPSSLAVLVSYLSDKKLKSIDLHIDINPSPNIDTYISRMDFYNLLEIERMESFMRHDEHGRFIPIKNINYKMNYELQEEIMTILNNKCKLSKEMYYTMDWAFNELLDNIIEHAESDTGGYFAAQVYSNTKRIEMCIVDNGIGIPNSLKKNPKYQEYEEYDCMVCSLNKGATKGTGQGNGLYYTKRFIEHCNSAMNIYSNKYFLNCTQNGLK